MNLLDPVPAAGPACEHWP